MLRRVSPLVLLLAACGGSSDARHPEYTAADARALAARGSGGSSAQEEEPLPVGRLPEGVTPLEYMLWMEVVPNRDRFRGRIDIRTRLDTPRRLIWLHGRGLNVTEAEALPGGDEPVPATYRQETDDGVASLRFDQPIGP